jgi:hypothetical protein
MRLDQELVRRLSHAAGYRMETIIAVVVGTFHPQLVLLQKV